MLLEILSYNIDRSLHELFRCMLTASKVLLASKRKTEDSPTIENWEDKIAEYAVMAKLTNYIQQQQHLYWHKNKLYKRKTN